MYKETKFRCDMEEFMRGYWTLEMPTKRGQYPICARGKTNGKTFQGLVFIFEHPATKELTPTQDWGGWWWSEPLLNFPLTPDDIEDFLDKLRED